MPSASCNGAFCFSERPAFFSLLSHDTWWVSVRNHEKKLKKMKILPVNGLGEGHSPNTQGPLMVTYFWNLRSTYFGDAPLPELYSTHFILFPTPLPTHTLEVK
jgi:hypothetical protein